MSQAPAAPTVHARDGDAAGDDGGAAAAPVVQAVAGAAASPPSVGGRHVQTASEAPQAQASMDAEDGDVPSGGCASTDGTRAYAPADCDRGLTLRHDSFLVGSATRGLTIDPGERQPRHPHVGPAQRANTANSPASSRETTSAMDTSGRAVTYAYTRAGHAAHGRALTIVRAARDKRVAQHESPPTTPSQSVSSRREVHSGSSSPASEGATRPRRMRSPPAPDADEARRRKARLTRFAEPSVTEIIEGSWGATGGESDVSDDEDRHEAAASAGPSDGQPAPQRPPAAQTAASIAAAAKIGLHTAGLAWLQQAQAMNAPRSAATEAPPRREREERGRATKDVPLMGQAARYEREMSWPVPSGFEWPRFAFCAFYEHSGEEREAYADILGEPVCSVANRRTILPPSANAWHFICDVREFLDAYPYPIRHQSNHVTCGRANWAAWRMWPQWILDGSLRATAEEFLWINCIGDRSEGEQPPTALQHLVGPPTYVVNGHQFGGPSKTYCKWARGLPVVPPTDVLPVDERWSELQVSG